MSEIVNGNPINQTEAVVPHNYSRFPLSEIFLDTHRFGEYHPHLVIDGYPKDKQPWRCVHNARSYTLKAPLMQDVQMHKDYFMVTQRAVLPFQSERVDKIPKLGDDVPKDAYTSIEDFHNKIQSLFVPMLAIVADSGETNFDRNTMLFKFLVLAESVFSRGSLLASLGCNLSSTILFKSATDELSTDDFFDKIISLFATWLATSALNVTIDGEQFIVVLEPSKIRPNREISIRNFLQRIRDTGDWRITGVGSYPLSNTLLTPFLSYSLNTPSGASLDYPIDLQSIWAYHLACAEYFTEDQVDYIYSADLFRQYIKSLWDNSVGGPAVFTWNGMDLQYDYLSAYYFDGAVSNFDPTTPEFLQYFLTLFGYHRSLRFRDYFVGSRTRPLAIADPNGTPTSVPVVGGQVDVINITKSIQGQRLLNAVMHTRSDWEGYMSAIFGETPNKDMHEPIHLAHTVDKMFVAENENTGDAVYQNTGGENTSQNSVTGVFRGNSGNFAFSVTPKEKCTIIGVTSYDIERCYPDMILRRFFVRDRYDQFLPQMQYIGDQPVYKHELFAADGSAFGSEFGYQSNGMQWKQMVNRCAGGFGSNKLPGYAFVLSRSGYGSSDHLSPDFIRARNSELDEFYLSLTGYSLGNYWHFILRQENLCDAERAMARKPQIL